VSEKPKAGDWWEKEGVRLRVIGEKRNGLTVGEHECGSIDLFRGQDGWQHLPKCTGFDWQEKTEEPDLLAALVNLRDQLEKMQRRVEKLESGNARHQILGVEYK